MVDTLFIPATGNTSKGDHPNPYSGGPLVYCTATTKDTGRILCLASTGDEQASCYHALTLS